jgi:hypothetical protein
MQVHLGLSAVVRQTQVAQLTVEETSKLDLIDPIWQVAGLVSEDLRVQVVERVDVDAVGLITEATILVCKCQLGTFNGVSGPTPAYALTEPFVPIRHIAATVPMHADNAWGETSSNHRSIQVMNEAGLRTSIFRLHLTASQLVDERVDDMVFLVIHPVGVEDQVGVEALATVEGQPLHPFVTLPTAEVLPGFELADDDLGQIGQGRQDVGEHPAIHTTGDEVLIPPIMVIVHRVDLVQDFPVFGREMGIFTHRHGEIFPAPLVAELVHAQTFSNNRHTLEQGEHRGRAGVDEANACHHAVVPWLDPHTLADRRYNGVVEHGMHELGRRAEAEKIVPLEVATDIHQHFWGQTSKVVLC